jgi:hypothetical protein
MSPELQVGTYLNRVAVRIARTFPHIMYYAPFVTNADIAGMPGQTPFVDRPGPRGMILILGGEHEREKSRFANRKLLSMRWARDNYASKRSAHSRSTFTFPTSPTLSDEDSPLSIN